MLFKYWYEFHIPFTVNHRATSVKCQNSKQNKFSSWISLSWNCYLSMSDTVCRTDNWVFAAAGTKAKLPSDGWNDNNSASALKLDWDSLPFLFLLQLFQLNTDLVLIKTLRCSFCNNKHLKKRLGDNFKLLPRAINVIVHLKWCISLRQKKTPITLTVVGCSFSLCSV